MGHSSQTTCKSESGGIYRSHGKRLLDITATILGMPVLIPVCLVVAILVRTRIGSPVLFSQTRAGRHGEPFRIYKFRTMTNETDADGQLLPDELRLTRFGQFMRSASLDELPEFWNILRGDMSLVGPRPLLMQYLPLYSKQQMRRHEVLPGLTGLAQVSGRNAISWPEKFAADVHYVDSCSFRLDLAIIFRTVLKIIQRDGISAPGEATMPFFTGTAREEPSGTDTERRNAE